MAVGWDGGRSRTYHFVFTLVRESKDKSGNVNVDLLHEPWSCLK